MKAKPTTQTASQLCTVSDLRAMLRLSKSKVYEMRSAGQLPRPLKFGSACRWRLSDIERWLQLGCPSLEKFEKLKGGK